ncbi:DUF3572 domain-containing protein [Pseudooceanicola sp.]|uniref:DUF3572 domain-containing protein n=1 Tax=Pseudooceanicola sp. TaxID=1914328 RepID=UPI0026199FBC|nr:DUF3572 domain-containing protein [Pseudooceanicola sp.]MDF1854849.1 DUF3572 domain-containing protein [Pseudooceanicola sp.]
MSQENAETIALTCLAWLVGDEDLLPVFQNASGASAEDLRQRMGEPGFLASVLEFLTMDDAWVIRCCDANGLAYEQPMMALAMLQGESRTHWT